jgi:hypothetical protein
LPSFQQEPSLFGPSRGGEKIDNLFPSDSDDDGNEDEDDSIIDKELTKVSST